MQCKGFAATIGMLLGLMMSHSVRAEEPVRIKALDVEYYRYVAPGQDAVIYPHEHKDALNLKLATEIGHSFYFNSKIVSETDAGQFRMIGLHINTGIHVSRYFDFEYMHRSEHAIDTQPSLPGYPLYDAVGIVIHLVPRSK